MRILIEKAAASDAEELLQYLKQVGSETDNLTFGAEGMPFSIEEEEAFLKAIEKSCDNVMFVAKTNGKIVGNASLSRLPRRMKHRGDFAVSVLKEYWNQSVGSKLLQAILEFAKENDFEMIDLQVRSDNLHAIHVYEKFGFEKVGTHPAFFKLDGEYIPFVFMCMNIAK